MVLHRVGLRLGDVHVPAGTRRRVLSVLRRVQTGSAAAMAAFGVVHLSAPLVGLLHLGGDVNDRVDAVSRWMLLGRVAYQSALGEALLWTALATHLLAGITKRLVTRFTTAAPTRTADNVRNVNVEEPTVVEEPLKRTAKLSVAQASGYMLAPFVLHHAWINRIVPSTPKPPISSLSPSELDYSFVAHTLSHPNTGVRIIMATAYTVLIAAFAVHTSYAIPALLRTIEPASRRKGSSRPRPALLASSLAIALLTSLVALVPVGAHGGLAISGMLKARYDAVLRSVFPTRLFFVRL